MLATLEPRLFMRSPLVKKCSLVTSSMMALLKGFERYEIRCLAEIGWLSCWFILF